MSIQNPSPRTPTIGRSPAVMMAAIITATSILAVGAGAAARSGPVPATRTTLVLQQASPAADLIPLSSLTDLTSLDATVTITVDGTVSGKPTQGDLTATVTNNDQGQSQIDVTGGLLGDIVAQVGGSAVNLFRPKRVSIYTVEEGTYVVVSGLFDLCVKPKDNMATAALDQLSPQTLLSILTENDVARGTFVADETLNGMPVKKYLMSGEAFLSAAQAVADPTVSSFAQSLRTATDADMYVSTDGGYPVAFRGGFGRAFEPLKFDGDLTVQIDLTGINTNTPVVLPDSCDHPISQ